MRIHSVLLSAVALLAFAGCSSTQPTYTAPTSGDLAVLRGEWMPSFMMDSDAIVEIITIDGAWTERRENVGRPNETRVAPGKRSIGVFIMGRDRLSGEQILEVDVVANHSYHVFAKLVGRTFDVVLWDDSKGEKEKTEVGRWKVPAAFGRTLPLYPGDK